MNHTYHTIEKAIRYLADNRGQQPSLGDVAAHVHLSPHHFQKLFSEWAGVSPKKFLQFITAEHAKTLLKSKHPLQDVAHQAGLSGTGRLHDLFVSLEAMTPGEYKNGGENLEITYSFFNSPYGPFVCASTEKGVCSLIFTDDEEAGVHQLSETFPNASLVNRTDVLHEKVSGILYQTSPGEERLRLHLKGTPFQVKVWRALLEIPAGRLQTYSGVADAIGRPKAVRAAASAVAKNPVAWLIPCHRVIRSTGVIGNYRWGSERKMAMIGRESAMNSAG